MTVERRIKALPKEVAYMTDANEEQIAQISGKKNVVRGILLMRIFELGARFVCGFVSVVFVATETELQVVGRGKLFRGRRGDGVC